MACINLKMQRYGLVTRERGIGWMDAKKGAYLVNIQDSRGVQQWQKLIVY